MIDQLEKNQEKDRFKQAEIAAISSMAMNILLAIVKGVIGVISNSRALLRA